MIAFVIVVPNVRVVIFVAVDAVVAVVGFVVFVIVVRVVNVVVVFIVVTVVSVAVSVRFSVVSPRCCCPMSQATCFA